ncbi:hypothetical protein F5Y10DRAFT_241106 [Nemania abortiva]|nr:hypothetical protein F5Y10DRAFT_241106 [Nemania abortiva]
MTGDTREMDSWRQVYRGDEPIYCAAPSPSSPNDIICPGSDEETDDATRAAKRRRYEKHGHRYLQGRPVRILSASLRGPFSKASGWQNPWLPKPPAHHVQRLDSLSQPPVASSAIPPESVIPADIPSSVEISYVQDLYDSMDCQLPSPQSHDDLQFFSSPSHSERRSRTESWADSILEKDDFWAPNHTVVDRPLEPATKRPAGRDWLKRRPAKRRMPYAAQSTEPSSTPTPMPSARSKANKRKGLLTGRPANRSFEMTTPSSSPDQEPRGSLVSADHQQEVLYEEIEQPILPNISAGGSCVSSEPPPPSREEEEALEVEDKGEEETENDNLPEDMCRDKSQRTASSSIGENIDFQDYADESFFYRARQLKQPTPPAASNTTVADCSPQYTQTEEPIPPKHNDAATVSSNRDIRKSGSKATYDHMCFNDAELAKRPSESPVAIKTHKGSNHPNFTPTESDHILRQCHKAIVPSCDVADTKANTNYALGADRSRSLNDITLNPRLNVCNATPQTILESKAVQSTNPGALLDDGPTLIGDPIDTEERGNIAAFQNSSIQSEHSLLQHYAISATLMANASQPSQCYDVINLSKTNDVESYSTDKIAQERVTKSHPTTSESTNKRSQKELTDVVTCSDAITGRDDEGIHQIIADDQTISANQQSPWAPLHVTNGSVQYDNDNIEPARHKPNDSPTNPDTALPNYPASIHYSPTIRPSQQSPWAGEVELSNKVSLEEISGMNPAIIMDIKSQSQRPILASDQQNFPLVVPPVSGREHQSPGSDADVEGIRTSIQEPPYTPILHIARQPTPDGDLSIRSFSNFNFSSPQRSSCPPGSSTSRGILSTRKYSSRRTSEKSSMRVLFAPLPHEQENNGILPPTRSRATSPPPPTLVDVEEENLDGRYRKHFDIMNRRLAVNEMPSRGYHRRLLPSSSQQKPESPSVEAMAEAFREADVHLLKQEDIDMVEGTQTDEGRTEGAVAEIEDKPQSPWQQDGEGMDDVAAVMGNLPEFLDVWDVDMEIDRNRAELNGVGGCGAPSDIDISILHGVGIW